MRLWFIGAAIIFVNYTVYEQLGLFVYIYGEEKLGDFILQSTVSLTCFNVKLNELYIIIAHYHKVPRLQLYSGP